MFNDHLSPWQNVLNNLFVVIMKLFNYFTLMIAVFMMSIIYATDTVSNTYLAQEEAPGEEAPAEEVKEEEAQAEDTPTEEVKEEGLGEETEKASKEKPEN